MTPEQLLKVVTILQGYCGEVIRFEVEPYAPSPDGTRSYSLHVWAVEEVSGAPAGTYLLEETV